MKKFVLGLLVGITISVSATSYAENALEKVEAYIRNDFPITLDGKDLAITSPKLMYDGTMYLPVRETATILGKDVNWNEETQTVELITKIEGEDKMEEKLSIMKIMEDHQNLFFDFITSGSVIEKINLVDKNKNNKILIENIPYTIEKDTVFIDKEYYDNNIKGKL